MFENLADSDIDIGVNSVKSGGAADPGQPAGTSDRDLPRSVVLAGGCSTAVDSCCVPAHPAMSRKEKIDTTLSLTRRLIFRNERIIASQLIILETSKVP
jgi:hypothetical protein